MVTVHSAESYDNGGIIPTTDVTLNPRHSQDSALPSATRPRPHSQQPVKPDNDLFISPASNLVSQPSFSQTCKTSCKQWQWIGSDLGFKPATFQSVVWRANHCSTWAHKIIMLKWIYQLIQHGQGFGHSCRVSKLRDFTKLEPSNCCRSLGIDICLFLYIAQFPIVLFVYMH
jgi:hypothetical protein